MSRIIKIFDTTLRDGEQSPGCSMNTVEKIEVALQLERLGVDVIEAGFAASSTGDFDAIVAITKSVKTPIICSLARAIEADVDAAARALKDATCPRIHTFIATSPIHMEHKLQLSPAAVIDRAVAAVTRAKTYMPDVEFSCEDAGRSDRDFLVKILTETIKAGATTVNIPDTVGYLMPTEYADLIRFLIQTVPGIDEVDVSVHCHDDLGLATANSLAGIVAGASQVECTINGIGERAGNAALEEIVMAIKTRPDQLRATTMIVTKELTKTSRLIANITGSTVQANKAIVGANAFAHEAGIHQDGVLKMRQTYEIMKMEDVGATVENLVIGKHSGRHAFTQKLQALGHQLSPDDIQKAFNRFKDLADRKKVISDKDIASIVANEIYQSTTGESEGFQLRYVQIVAGNTTRPTATVQLIHHGNQLEGSHTGEGPVDAIYRTIDALIGEPITLVDFVIHAVTGGTDALGEVTVRIADENTIFVGRGSDTDVLVAAATAYIVAINKMMAYRKNTRTASSLSD